MIKDSGDRTKFESGAVRDMRVGKGRCDLLPLAEAGELIEASKSKHSTAAKEVLVKISEFMANGDTKHLSEALLLFGDKIGGRDNPNADLMKWCAEDMLLNVAIHYEEGAAKYGEFNWQKGIPSYVYIDSGIRHLLKHLKGMTDEPHDRAFIWNMLGAMWTVKNYPDLAYILDPKEGYVIKSQRKKASK